MKPAARPRAVAGVDEAGLGPRLGPLVFGATLFRGAADALADLHAALRGVVDRDPGAVPGRLAIDDSKRIFAGRRSLGPLELAALATLLPGRPVAGALEDLVGGDGVARPPWYAPEADGSRLPVAADAGAVLDWRARWPRELAAIGVEHVASFVRPVFEDELNGCFVSGLNKAQAVLTRVAPILRRLAELAPGCDLEVRVDRLGGRRYHADFLRATFPLRPVSVLEENELCSSYALRDAGRTITVFFEVEGDGRHLPVALASIGAKYVRELCVRRLNAHFGRRLPGLAPTAGYPQDAERWLEQARAVLSDGELAGLVRRR